VLEDVDEQERKHANREHRQRDPRTRPHNLETAERQTEKDRQAGEGAQEDGLSE
jgi:hypothetical protein